ncbi:MAG: N-6 DNA methylase [Prevotellaceae bacterium]|nr:N-6 DNA methylase [Candidatus Colivivens equi]
MDIIEAWAESQDFQIKLDSKGKIIDYLDEDIRRENKPEERVRQKMACILNKDFRYPKELIALERSIKIGIETKRADIVIYKSIEAKKSNNQGCILLIAEIKAPNIKEPDGQLISYLSASSAEGGFWTNGDTIVYYKKNEGNTIEEYISIPKYGEPWDAIGKHKKSDLVPPIDLKLTFKRCHNAMFRAGIDSEDIALDMTRILLAKHEDEESSDEDCKFRMTQEEYKDLSKRKLACNRVRSLFKDVRERFPDVFTATEEITVSDEQLAIVISQLQHYAFLDSPYDVIGTAYEIYVASHLKGERGQYFTNRLVVNMMVKMVAPNDTSIILDPSCGSGGFLIAAMNQIFKNIDVSARTQTAKDVIKRRVVHQLFGVDISPKLVKIAKANMLLGKDGHGGIERSDSLKGTEGLSASFKERCGLKMPSIILSNPPFGAGHELRIKNRQVLEKFDVGKTWYLNENGELCCEEDKYNEGIGVAPEILFAEQYLKWIKDDGLICFVIAKGQLDNREAMIMRSKYLTETQILAIINLHEDTFQPFCGSKAAVILAKKCTPPRDYKIFMAISNKVGQTSRGASILKTNAEGEPLVENGHLVLDEDLSEIAEAYKQFQHGELVESEFRFTISNTDIDKESLSFNPIHYLPKYNYALQKVLELRERDDFDVVPLSALAEVYNGPRFKRPYADTGVVSGEGIRKYFTGTAMTQLNSDNVKYLDEKKCTKAQKKQLELLTVHKGYILVSDSGTLGRVTYALDQHDGHVATNNLIRIVIEDENLRGYVFQYLRSDIGQSLMLKNSYGTNQEHLEPDVIKDILVPVPKDINTLNEIGEAVIESIRNLESSIILNKKADNLFNQLF